MDWESAEQLRGLTTVMRGSVEAAIDGTTISEQQELSLKQPIVKGPVWVSRFTLLPPEKDVIRQKLFSIIDELAEENIPYKRPNSQAICMEWVGYRKGVSPDASEPQISEAEKIFGLMTETSSTEVVVFLYGGTFIINNQATYRKSLARLSKATSLPCVTFHQRLAPQNPFPAALLDILHGYMTLLSPPPEAPYTPYSGTSIVLAGDSSGACLALGLLQVLLTLKRQGVTSLEYNGRQVELVLPAGLTLLSGVGELTNALPSFEANYHSDIFPSGHPPYLLPDFPACEIWPSNPPRGNIYCETPFLYHPITSPTMSKDWRNSPPLWFASGQEMVIDAMKIIAQTAFNQGVTIRFQEFEAMPHIFMWSLPGSPQSQKCLQDWADACKALLKGDISSSKGTFVKAKGLQPLPLDLEKLTPLTVDIALAKSREASKKWVDYTGQRMNSSKL